MPARTITHPSGATLKVVVHDVSTGGLRWWNAATNAFEAFNPGNVALYGVAANEVGNTGTYLWTVPATLPSLAVPNEYAATAYEVDGDELSADALEDADAVWRFTFGWTGANFRLSGTAVVLPISISLEHGGQASILGATEANLWCFQYEAGVLRASIFDPLGAAIDLTGHTLRFMLHDEGSDDALVEVESPDVAVAGEEFNQAVILLEALTQAARTKRYVLRDITAANTVYMYGNFEVLAAPIDAA